MYKKGIFFKYDKIANIEQKYQVRCKCGTKTVMIKADKTICRGCGNYIFRTPQIEFRERLKERIRKMNNDLLAERYHNELERKYYHDLSNVDREKHDDLIDALKEAERELEDVKAGNEWLLENIKDFVKNDNMSGLVEFLESEGISL